MTNRVTTNMQKVVTAVSNAAKAVTQPVQIKLSTNSANATPGAPNKP